MNRSLALLISVTLVGEVAANLSTGALPLALERDGAAPAHIALAMGAGVFAQMLGSVPVGALVDRVGRLLTLRGAVLGMAAASAGMALLHGAFWGGACSALRGFSMMAYVTAAFAYITEIVPEGRSVSAVSSLGMIANVAFAFAPALAVVFWNHGIGREMFGYGALATLVGAVPLALLPARHDVRSGRRSRTIFMRSKWLPAMTFLVAAALQSGVNGSIAVLTFAHRGVANGALIFTSMALMTFALRYPASRFVEKYGARLMAIPVAVFQLVGCLLAARASSAASVLLAGAFLGTGWSAIVPVGIGLFFEHSSRRTRGVAMGSYSLSFAVGMSGGALLAAVCTRFGFGYGAAMTACAFAATLALPWVLWAYRSKGQTFAAS